MRATVVVFVAVAVAAAASAAVDQARVKRDTCNSMCGGVGGQALQDQEDRIARLAELVHELEEMADDNLSHNDEEALMALDSRLDKFTGDGCPNGDFQCGGLTRQCVSSLYVCDGEDDCNNGHDEDEHTCHLLPESGTAWVGGKVYDDCTNRKPYEIQVSIGDVDITKWFTARPKVQGTVVLRSKNRKYTATASLPASGLYDYAHRSLYFAPPEADRLGLELTWDTGSNDSVNCYIVRESTGEHCAHFVLYKK